MVQANYLLSLSLTNSIKIPAKYKSILNEALLKMKLNAFIMMICDLYSIPVYNVSTKLAILGLRSCTYPRVRVQPLWHFLFFSTVGCFPRQALSLFWDPFLLLPTSYFLIAQQNAFSWYLIHKHMHRPSTNFSWSVTFIFIPLLWWPTTPRTFCYIMLWHNLHLKHLSFYFISLRFPLKLGQMGISVMVIFWQWVTCWYVKGC